jgi:superfamily II DNA or RNA helicase
MVALEDLQVGLMVRGIVTGQVVTLVSVEKSGKNAVVVVYRQDNGKVAESLLYREKEAELEIVSDELRWTFAGDAKTFKLVSEAYRIHLSYLFDPLMAVHTSKIEPLPHQITAVYDEMLPRQPLRFLLADDPGAGKTIMAGLLIRELVLRGDVRRCLVVAPGSLTEQWQDELWEKFQLNFSILTPEMVEMSRGGNPFAEKDLLIARIDQLKRSEELITRLEQSDWDLIICDEAHKMSASFFGNDLKETKRYKLGKRLSKVARHFLLMTATPHNGKEEDFQLFLALLDQDRFEGRFRDGVHQVDVSDLMRRMVKERLLKFDGKPLFPERRAYTVNYTLSPEESALYDAVTDYVRQEFNRADELGNDGRKGTVGFALTILQRRLASSPEALLQSLKRRRERLEKRLKEAQASRQRTLELDLPIYDDEDWDDIEDLPEAEQEALLIDSATAARTVDELRAEIVLLKDLEAQASRLRSSGVDRKWSELSRILQDTPEMKSQDGARRKLVIFTEHRDTLNYLHGRLVTLFGGDEAVITIHGGIKREERLNRQNSFRNDPNAWILLATDAAGEGINLQRAHLMINYDLPWNPNRLEQRFGRIHRIGQTEVCHLWNLVAGETREGQVYAHLLRKLAVERGALDGQVFDVLGKLFQETPLRELLVRAVRYGDKPEVRAQLEQAVDNATDRERVRQLLEHESLIASSMDVSQILHLREEMERASARRLQPFYVKAFFLQAFDHLKGTYHPRENGRYSVSNVPASIRNHAKTHGLGAIATQYERICFDKALVNVAGKPQAEFVFPGHPLLDATLDLILSQARDALKTGTILIDDTDLSTSPRVLFFLEQGIQDGQTNANGEKRTISREVHFLELDSNGEIREAGGAPYLDYRAPEADELPHLQALLAEDWLKGNALEKRALEYAVETLVPRHLERVRVRRLEWIDKTQRAVHERLTKEINYWDYRANQLAQQERAGKPNAHLNSKQARERADKLQERLQQRTAQLEQERNIYSTRPIVVGGVLVVPMGALLRGNPPSELLDRRHVERLAMRAVMDAEARLGYEVTDVSAQNLGYDIESKDKTTGRLRFIEVKGRRADADGITMTRNELLCAFNAPSQHILAIVRVDGATVHPPRYVRRFFTKEPEASAISVTYSLQELLNASEEPS